MGRTVMIGIAGNNFYRGYPVEGKPPLDLPPEIRVMAMEVFRWLDQHDSIEALKIPAVGKVDAN